jgi:DnaJ like chaperone protein
MQWYGKVIGTLLGLAVGRSLGGAAAGLVLGHLYDSGVAAKSTGRASTAEIRTAFYDTTFAVMGHLAKFDGRVSEQEISAARAVMRFLALDESQTAQAIHCFGRGKASGYTLAAEVGHLRELCAREPQLLRFFMELQVRAAIAGNGLVEPIRGRLWLVGEALGISAQELAHLELIERARVATPAGRPAGSALRQAYELLGIDASASDEAVKKAYRRQMSENHPDKLVARGLPESMQELAKENTQRVREAYETIAASRGFR